MSYCHVCGTSLPAGSSTCPACGAATTTSPNVPPATPVYTAPASGLTPNVAGALAYVLGAITGIVFLLIEPFKNDRFVRFHAFQAIFFNLVWIAFWIVWGIVGLALSAVSHGLFFIIQLPVNLLVTVGGFCLWAFLMYQAWQGKTYQLPVIGPMAANQAGIAPVTGQRL